MAPESKGQCVSWHCSQALEAEYSAACFLDGKPSALSRLTRTAAKSSCAAKTKVTSRRFPYGTTSAPLTERDGEVLLMWYRLAFLVSRSPSLASGGGPRMSAICGPRPSEYYAKYDRDTRSLKTCQASLFPDISTGSWLTFTKAGLMRDGCVYPQPKLERRTGETACGYWPTPTAADKRGHAGEYPKTKTHHEGLTSATAVRKWPTPHANASTGPGSQGREGGDNLQTAVQRGGTKTRQTWPTPRSGNDAMVGRSGHRAKLQGTELQTGRGQLNPDWVAWLMGWPIGWTALEPLEMARFREWSRRHGGG